MAILEHSGHDFDRLRARWESFAKQESWDLTIISEEAGYPVMAIENKAAKEEIGGGVYLSAGVHGDECAPVWALLEWAENRGRELSETGRPFTVMPCLNPYGLVENTRKDHRGVDLNRSFHDTGVPMIAAWQKFLEGTCFDVAVNLHEDYDVGGIYLYELARSASIGDHLLSACEGIIPRETAADVDGSDFENGLMQREIDEAEMRRVVGEDLDGWPEAIWLFLDHATDAFTFETPSEMALEHRIKAHRSFLDAVVKY
tara:strand:+ start:475 stop:1248 length:774 start_codon:yes stop_codon:yes gene_type:complete